MALLRSLRCPTAFGVRLLNPDLEDFKDVDDFFSGVITPIVENDLGYELVVVDGGRNEEPLINLEIFKNLHRSSVVIVDITGGRPNCFIELGYALARGAPVMVNARKGSPGSFSFRHLGANQVLWGKRSLL